ncbi:selenoprotein K isoform X1 [Microtus ochrogaster]|uniref:Selenoprotein K n=1 Tax=Microtus ochrogaster TaxID=79684 RepID=A0ABM1AI91_MICOH|nr:selenoprotein K isoform X1 [Microtus ochrogaster]
MVYISNGQVLDSRNQSPWRLSFITDFFWGIAEFVVFFFKTLLQQDVKKRRGYGSSSGSRYDDGRGHQETLHEEEWVGSIIFKAPAPLQWVVDEEGKRLL